MAVLQGWQAAECFKYRRKMAPPLILLLLLLAAGRGGADEVYRCDNRTLTCVTEGVRGQPRPHCRGKTLLEGPGGYLSDGPGNYSTDAKCTWVIRSSSPNATIRSVPSPLSSSVCWIYSILSYHQKAGKYLNRSLSTITKVVVLTFEHFESIQSSGNCNLCRYSGKLPFKLIL